jgi:multicomponent Na+:H+ antiporter subunit F
MVNNIYLQIATVITLIAFIIGMYRFVKGPHKADRMVAFDMVSVAGIALIGFIAAFTNKLIYLDVALVYGILGFLGVVIIGRYIERGF